MTHSPPAVGMPRTHPPPQEFMPTKEEESMLLNFNGDKTKLAKAEQVNNVVEFTPVRLRKPVVAVVLVFCYGDDGRPATALGFWSWRRRRAC